MRNTFFIIFLFLYHHCICQNNFDYNPLSTSNSSISKIKESISQRLKADLSTIDSDHSKQITEYYQNRAEWLINHIDEENLIYDITFTSYVENVLNNVLKGNPGIKAPDRILIDRNTSANALCLGEGTLVVNLGLLRRIENESQLAFVIAHELAHYINDHVNRTFNSRIDQIYSKETAKKIKSIRKDRESRLQKTLELLKGIMYTGMKYSREFELEADSLAITYLVNSPYDVKASLSLLEMLDSADFPKYTYKPVLDSIFDFDKFPFRKEWLQEEEVFFNAGNPSFFNLDSLKTHPDIKVRLEHINKLIPEKVNGKLNIQPQQTLQWINSTSDFEIIESAYFLEDYERCLFLTLQALRVYKDHPYLHNMIGKVFIKLYEARRDHSFGKYVPASSKAFNPGIKEINTFLNNLRLSEIGSIGLLYMNKEENFDTTNQEHYYLLWKLSVLTGNENLETQVVDAYKQKFPGGEYMEHFSKPN